MHKVNLSKAFDTISESWRPKVIGALNGQVVKLARLDGTFVWHKHEDADELFFCRRGRLFIETRDGAVALDAGELVIVPKGVVHRTRTEHEAEVLLFEPAATRNTGDVTDAVFTAPIDEPL